MLHRFRLQSPLALCQQRLVTIRVMDRSQPPRVFISYSHDSPRHEQQVFALSDRLRKDGVDAIIDQYESFPAMGWPFWMESQIREADYVVIVCSTANLSRVEHRDKAHEGHGVIWEVNIVYNLLYSEPLLNRKFVPVLFEGTLPDAIPLPLK
jgi:hypothetical protein